MDEQVRPIEHELPSARNVASGIGPSEPSPGSAWRMLSPRPIPERHAGHDQRQHKQMLHRPMLALAHQRFHAAMFACSAGSDDESRRLFEAEWIEEAATR